MSSGVFALFDRIAPPARFGCGFEVSGCVTFGFAAGSAISRRTTSPTDKQNRNVESDGQTHRTSLTMITAVSSPVGSEIFSVVALLVISLGVLLVLRHYLPLRTTPAYLLVPIFFALGLPASIILLVPIDLASSARDQDAGSRGIWLPDRVLLVSWRISYWLTFSLTWYFAGLEISFFVSNTL
jgi:LMBR1-like membrane protein